MKSPADKHEFWSIWSSKWWSDVIVSEFIWNQICLGKLRWTNFTGIRKFQMNKLRIWIHGTQGRNQEWKLGCATFALGWELKKIGKVCFVFKDYLTCIYNIGLNTLIFIFTSSTRSCIKIPSTKVITSIQQNKIDTNQLPIK